MMTIHRLFPTFIYSSALHSRGSREFNRQLLKECRQLRHDDAAGRRWSAENYPGGYTSYGSVHWLQRISPTFKLLERKLERHVKAFAAAVEWDLNGGDLHMTDCWININPKHVVHGLHLHPLSFISGTYYLHQNGANNSSDLTNPAAGLVQDLFHTNLGNVGGIAQNGVESLPRLRYRARLGWSNGPWSVTGFMDYQSHFFHTQNAPPNVNSQCLAAGGTVGGGTFPCLINNYNNIEPSYYTFDLSIGYDTGDDPVNTYLKHVGIQLVVQNLMDRHPAFEYRIGTGAGNPAAFDISKSDSGRTIGLILTKTW